MKTAAVIPAFNNARTVVGIVREAKKHVDTVIVVDDCSTDNTRTILKRLASRGVCTLLSHETNRGKGEAIKSALAHLKGQGVRAQPDAVALLDADGEHMPGEIPRFLAALKHVDVVLGARRAYRSRARRRLNSWMGFWLRLLDRNVRDPSCGFRAFSWPLLKKMELRSSDFCIDLELVLESIKAGASIKSIEVSSILHPLSSVSRRDFIRMSDFFDRWILKNANEPFLFTRRRPLLLAGASLGYLVGTILLRAPW